MDNKENILITFVLPCFKVEEFIQLCLDSIYEVNLPESKFEVLCINDCSPDNTQKVLEQNQRKHSNLRIVIHEHNKGHGGARNTGIREAKGKYIWFVDSDDAITASRLSELLRKVDNRELDLLCFNHRRIDAEGNELSTELFFKDSEVLDGFSFAESVFGHCGIVYYMMFVWRFIYRTQYIRDLHLLFPEKVAFEETVFVSKTVLNAKRVASFSDVMYSYRFNANSTMGSFFRTYPAKLIWDQTFSVGLNLLHFSNEIKDKALNEAYRNWAISNHLNGFAIYLFRTSKEERWKFYQIVKSHNAEIGEARPYLTMLNKLLLFHVLGHFFATLLSTIYKRTH